MRCYTFLSMRQTADIPYVMNKETDFEKIQLLEKRITTIPFNHISYYESIKNGFGIVWSIEPFLTLHSYSCHNLNHIRFYTVYYQLWGFKKN